MRLETLIAAFPPFYSVTFPDTLLKSFYLMFVTLKLLVLTATLISLELSLEKEMIIPGEPSCLPSLSGTTARWLCQPQTSSSSSCSSPISLPSNFPFESCSSWCNDILPFLLPRLQPLHVLLVFSLAGTCNPWDGSCWACGTSVLGFGWEGSWVLDESSSIFSAQSHCWHRGSCSAGRYQIIEKQSTRARLFSKQL